MFISTSANFCPLDNSFLLAGFVQPPQFRDGAVALHQRLVARLLCVARGFGSPFADEQIPIGLDRLRRYRISQLPFDLCGDLTKRHPPFEAQMRHERQTGIPAVFRRFVVAWV